MLNGLDLFSGYGGIALGLSRWSKPIAYCEIDAFAQSVLLSRMADGTLPRGPIWDDVRTFDGRPFRGHIDLIHSGFPCQDISVAGAGAGLAGERSGLVKEVYRLADEIKPRFLFFENVPAIRTRGLSSIVRKLASLGYDSRWCMLAASDIGAPHQRKRWFLLAHANGEGLEVGTCEQGNPCEERASAVGSVPAAYAKTWGNKIDSRILRISDGTPHRVDRIKSIGAGVVPAQVERAFEILIGEYA